MAEIAGLTVEIVPIETDEDRRLFGMALHAIHRMLVEIVMEQRELAKGEINEYMGNSTFDPDRVGDRIPCNPGRPAISEFMNGGGK